MQGNTSFNSMLRTQRTPLMICFEDDHAGIKAMRVIAYAIILLVSLIGNFFVIGVLCEDRKMRKPVNYLIANMAAADLAITVVYMPRMISSVIRSYKWVVDGTIGLILCKIAPTLHLVSIKVSILTLVFLSVERLMAVSPLARKRLRVRSVKIIIFFIWLVSTAIHVPNLYGLKLKSGLGGTKICVAYLNEFFESSKGRKIYDNVLAMIFYAISFGLIVVLYTLAAVKLRRRIVRGVERFSDGNGHRTGAANERFPSNLWNAILGCTEYL